MQTQPNSPHFASLLWCFLCSAALLLNSYLEGFGINRGCDTEINCSRLAQLPIRDEDIGRTCLSSFMAQTASSFKLRMHVIIDRTQKGCLGFCWWQETISEPFLHDQSMVTKVIQRMGHALGTKLTLTHMLIKLKKTFLGGGGGERVHCQ